MNYVAISTFFFTKIMINLNNQLLLNLQWAHFPHIHFGLTLDSKKQVKLDDTIATPAPQKAKGFY